MVEEGRGYAFQAERPRTPFLRRPHGGGYPRPTEIFIPELLMTAEIAERHEMGQRVTGKTAIAIHDVMQTYVAYPFDAPDHVVQPQKDENDSIATRAMISEFDKNDRRIYVHGEGLKDILNGADIPLINGVHGLGGIEVNPLKPGEVVEEYAEVDPLEGTTLSTKRPEGEKRDVKSQGVMSTAAISGPGGFIEIPDDADYMEKLFAPNVAGLSLEDPADITIAKVLHGLNIYPGQLRVTILDRPRNRDYIQAAEEMAVQLNLIDAGDLLPSVLAGEDPGPDGIYNMVMGIGGAPEGVIAAAAGKATGKTFVEARFYPKDPEARRKYKRVLNINDLVPAKANTIVVELAHVTPDSKYTGAQGVRRLQNGHTLHLVDFTSVDYAGRRHHTRQFSE